jgi:hypothetical protein
MAVAMLTLFFALHLTLSQLRSNHQERKIIHRTETKETDRLQRQRDSLMKLDHHYDSLLTSAISNSGVAITIDRIINKMEKGIQLISIHAEHQDRDTMKFEFAGMTSSGDVLYQWSDRLRQLDIGEPVIRSIEKKDDKYTFLFSI